MFHLQSPRNKKLKREKFGIQRKEKERVIITSKSIVKEEINLYQYCDRCKTEKGYYRITYEMDKRAIRCSYCAKITKIVTL